MFIFLLWNADSVQLIQLICSLWISNRHSHPTMYKYKFKNKQTHFLK